jgi:membrane protease YdiL (CAAX protease family)
MGGVGDILRGHQLVAFYALTFLFSWYFWSMAASVPEQRGLYVLVGGFGPSLFGVLFILILNGADGLWRLLSRLVNWSVNPVWYAFALFGTLLLAVPAVVLGGIGLGWFDPSGWFSVLVYFGNILLVNVLGQEIGWRGFVLPRLQKDAVAVVSSLVLGFLWSLWYLPLWYVPGDPHQMIPFPAFFIMTMGISILYTWMYNNTSGSLLLTGLFHAASNTTLGLLPLVSEATSGNIIPVYASAFLICVAAAAVTVVYGPTYLSRNEKYSFLGGFSWEYED